LGGRINSDFNPDQGVSGAHDDGSSSSHSHLEELLLGSPTKKSDFNPDQGVSGAHDDGSSSSHSHLEEPLLGSPTKKSDFNPDQGVSSIRARTPSEFEAYLPIYSDNLKGEFWKYPTKIYWEENNSESKCMFMNAQGLVPLIVSDHRKKVVMTLKTLFYLENRIIINLKSTGFFMYIHGKSFRLENFDLLLKGEISEEDFKKDLVKNNPDNYRRVWDVLTRGAQFVALYY
jgi:hypothetical protein